MASIALAASELRGGKPGRSGTLIQIGLLTLLVVLAGLLGQAVFAGMSEGYCLIWPSIGTRFAPGYSESKFNAVQPGTSRQEVTALIGRPLGEGPFSAPPGHALAQPGDVVWQYSSDSSARGGDWAWLSREVVFRNGKVAHTVRWIYYD